MTHPGGRYDEIGRSYARTREEDPRVAMAIHDALGDGRSLVNLGAGSGNYEPGDRQVVAVEPSVAMMRQRQGRSPSVVRAVAESLPFPDLAFDAAMPVLTIHHWSAPATGLREMARVSRRQVILYFEPLATHDFWALEYFPQALNLPTEQDPPGEALLREELAVREVRTVLVPPDCLDGFAAAFWARPEAYLDPEVQAGMSWLALLPPDVRAEGSTRLRSDLASGRWDARHGHLRTQAAYDGGYRLAIAG